MTMTTSETNTHMIGVQLYVDENNDRFFFCCDDEDKPVIKKMFEIYDKQKDNRTSTTTS